MARLNGAHDLADIHPLAKQDIGFTKLVNDLLIWLFTTLDLDQEFGARSAPWKLLIKTIAYI